MIQVGQTQRKVGQLQRSYIQSSVTNYIAPLRTFLEGDMKTITVSGFITAKYHSTLHQRNTISSSLCCLVFLWIIYLIVVGLQVLKNTQVM